MDRLSAVRASLPSRPSLRSTLRHRILQNTLRYSEYCPCRMYFPRRGMHPVLALHALSRSRHWGAFLLLHPCIPVLKPVFFDSFALVFSSGRQWVSSAIGSKNAALSRWRSLRLEARRVAPSCRLLLVDWSTKWGMQINLALSLKC